MKTAYTYGDLLRVPFSIVRQEHLRREFLSYIEEHPGCFREVVFFVCETHDIRSVDYMHSAAEKIRPMFAALRKRGIRVGVNILSTLGHHQEIKDDSLDGLDFQVYEKGEVNRGRLCPTSKKNLAFIGDVYRVFASLSPDIIYSDDDIDYGVNVCKCPLCLQAFEKTFGDFSHSGLPVTTESYTALYESDDPAVREKFRGDWTAFTRIRTAALLSEIEKAVHVVDAKIQLGYMSCITDKPKQTVEEYAQVFSAGQPLKWRPGGGLYTDKEPLRLMEKANNIARQIKDLPPFVQEIQSEIENFPYQTFRKSVRFTRMEALAYLMAGCTGTAFNILSWQSGVSSLEEFKPYLGISEQIRPFAEEFVRLFGRNEAVGVGSYYNERMLLDLENRGFAHVYEDNFYQIGIPPAYQTKNMKVFLLNERLAESLTREEALAVLRNGVFLDAKALNVLNRMGLEQYTGFRSGKAYCKGVKEQTVPNRITGSGIDDRHICLEFSINGHSEFDKTDPVYSLEKSGDGAEWLTQLVDYLGRPVEFASGVYENELGGRVCVGGFAPFSWCMGDARMKQIKQILRWLSKDSLPAYVFNSAKAALWCRNDKNIRISFANLSLDALDRLEIAVLNYKGKLKYTMYCDGGYKTFYAAPVREEAPYSVYSIPQVEPFGMGFLYSE